MNNSESTPTPALDKPSAAKVIGVSVRSLERLVKLGKVPHVRVLGRVVFHASTLDEWLRSQAIASVGTASAVGEVRQ